MLPVTLTVFLHDLVMAQPPNVRKILRSYYEVELSKPAEVFNFVVATPIKEEVLYRGAAWILLLATLLLNRYFPHKKIIRGCGYAAAWAALLYCTIGWAAGHHYPLTVFGYGVLWGWLMFAMRGKWYSIVYPMLFHSASNALAFLYICLGYHLIY